VAAAALVPAQVAADTLGGERLASPNSTVLLQPGADPLPVVKAATWILADAETGEVLAQKGSHVPRAPASTLKMLTALTVLPRTSPETEYVATSRAAYIYGARAGLARDDFARYASTVTAQFPDVKGKGSHPIYTTNRLLLHGWRGAIGVKTGFTSRAGRTYVGAARRDGRTLIVSLMGIRESSEGAAKKLLKWGFANADQVTPIGTLLEPGAPVPAEDDSPLGSNGDGTGPAAVASGPLDGAASSDGGTATTAAAPTGEPSSLPPAVLIGAVVLVAGGAVTVLVARRARARPAGRHAT
jgi:D-alanyl-D-alanine carboxypeptidase